MNNTHRLHPCHYCDYNQDGIYNDYRTYSCPYSYDHYVPVDDEMEDNSRLMGNAPIVLKDYGPQPFVVNINEATKQNNNYRIGLWTGNNLQVTLMSIKVGDDIGLEVHPKIDQFIRIEDGQGIVKMGKSKESLDFQANVYDDFAIMIPAGTWHNVINTGNKPLKVYSIYAPPQHPAGVVHVTKPAE
ncbi:cupin [Clostridium gelidum]|uniref:Cupin n=1 Tax=Clostridium gelidum TaxID=704125 RepID=A0ABM7THL2_9CLOT|nr:cupin domain-containing protein [Clostridium gelidum]BCZ48108.1 cupin [Clostridium gelidum]